MKGDRIMFKRAVHPGEILKDELGELAISLTEFARQIDVPANRVSQIIAGKRAVTGDTALRFGHWFGMDPQFWLNLQAQFELAIADRESGEAIRHLPTKAGRPAAPEQPRMV
jgi:addiction module HigA family antidote